MQGIKRGSSKKGQPLSGWQGEAERLFNIVSHYRAALVFERWICVAVPIMPHYVNIAWGNFFGHVFLH